MIHTEECKKAQAALEKHVERFEREHPDYCRKCGGYGGHATPYNYWEPPDFDFCPDCIEKNKCPHCMKETLVEETNYEFCRMCGWSMVQVGCRAPSEGLDIYGDGMCGCENMGGEE